MRVVAWDLETTDLSASMGIVLCSCLKPIVPSGKPIAFTVKDVKGLTPDKEVLRKTKEELEKYDLVVTYNGKRFDVPMLNARLLRCGLPYANIKWHLDVSKFVRAPYLRIVSRRYIKLLVVQTFMRVPEPERKTPLDTDTWVLAAQSDPKALRKVREHCLRDVKVLEHVYWKVLPLVRSLSRS